MSETLKDPSKAAHEIGEPFDDGDAIRNGGVRLTAANKNPWYVLATIYGEQEEDAVLFGDDDVHVGYDCVLAQKNRRAWNLLACLDLSDEQRQKCADFTGLKLADIAPHSDPDKAKAELSEIRRKFQDRMGTAADFPVREEGVDFSKTIFSRPVSFKKMIFERKAYFNPTRFLRFVDFNTTFFSNDAYFKSTCFVGYADFRLVCFSKDGDFRASHFSRGAYFRATHFLGDAKFQDSSFLADVYFRSVRFSRAVEFNSTFFKSKTRFTDARFLTHVPEFHAAELYDDTVFPIPHKHTEDWPPQSGAVKVEGWDKPVDVMPADEQKRAYNRLRLFMNRSLQIEGEQFFHRQEMRCKREIEPSFWMTALYGWFDRLSDYGNSVWRPVAWLAVLIAFGAAMMLFHLEMGEPATGDKFWTSLGWSISNMLPFLGVGKLYYGGDFAACLPVWLKVLGGFQTLLGFILLFLLGLGLRNMFRLR